ncbi:hypothetical protein AB0C69_34910 [Actinomadura sp. NPDC048032]|uniref:hypothetical protein n=1 Tax=Actinomadura sp. NPDC048032 TaxID=3155747 RepID=UPI0033C24D02
MLGLLWTNHDWEAGTLRLTHTVKRIKDHDKTSNHKTSLVLSESKTAKSQPTLVLTLEIMSKLRTLHADQAKARLAPGEAWQDHG